MKKVCILLLASAFFLAACNNNKDKENTGTDNREKDDYRGNKDAQWSSADKKKYSRQCMDEALDKGVEEKLAEKVCDCSLEKLEKKFSSYADADGTSSNAAFITNAIKDCAVEVSGRNNNTNNTEGWSPADERRFMNDCVPEASAKVGSVRANQYCDCMLQKIKGLYSSLTEANNRYTELPSDQAQAMMNDCNRND